MRGSHLRQKLGATRPVRWFTDQPPVARAIAAVTRASLVQPSVAFAARELTGRRYTRTYRLRDGGLLVSLRHASTDASVLDEVFLARIYEPPAPVSERLAALDRPLRIADLGANVGLFGAFAFSRWPVAQVVAFEPHPGNAALVQEAIDANELADRWTLIAACAFTHDTRLPFTLDNFSDSHVGRSGDPAAADGTVLVAAVDVFERCGDADLVKIDIEGGEWALLADARLEQLPAAAIAIEYHPLMAPGSDTRALATAALERAGYTVAPVSHDARGNGMLWAWRAAEPAPLSGRPDPL